MRLLESMPRERGFAHLRVGGGEIDGEANVQRRVVGDALAELLEAAPEQVEGTARLVDGGVRGRQRAVQVGPRLGREVARTRCRLELADRLGVVGASGGQAAQAGVGARSKRWLVALLELR